MPNSSNLPKHIKRCVLHMPTFKGTNPPKIARFVDEIFKLNESSPEGLTENNIRDCASHYAYVCHRQQYSSFMDRYKKYSYLVAERCIEFQRQQRQRQKEPEDDEGMADAPLRLPDLSKTGIDRLTYARFADQLIHRNPERILDKAQVDDTLGKVLDAYLRKGKAGIKGDPEGSRSDLLGRQSKKYWVVKVGYLNGNMAGGSS